MWRMATRLGNSGLKHSITFEGIGRDEVEMDRGTSQSRERVERSCPDVARTSEAGGRREVRQGEVRARVVQG